MRVLHLFSNHRWTGPAEPALNLCLALRDLGVDIDFACSPGPGLAQNKIVARARERALEPILDFQLLKRRNPIRNWQDRRRLRRFLATRSYDLIHCHLPNDHEIARDPAHDVGIPLVRTSYEGTGFRLRDKTPLLLAHTARLIEPSHIAADYDHAAYAFPREKIRVVPNAVDTDRFNTARALPDGRARLGIPADAFVLGIVARMQTHRHYHDLFEAFAQFVKVRPGARLVVIGRGTKQDEVAYRPVQHLGLADSVHLAGFVEGDDYVGLLAALDAAVYLVPGSDGTCRAVRELLAMAKPVITADRGMLREIVHHGETGLVTDGSAPALAAAFQTLHDNIDLRKHMAANARATAESHYSLSAQSAAVLKIYREILEN